MRVVRPSRKFNSMKWLEFRFLILVEEDREISSLTMAKLVELCVQEA